MVWKEFGLESSGDDSESANRDSKVNVKAPKSIISTRRSSRKRRRVVFKLDDSSSDDDQGFDSITDAIESVLQAAKRRTDAAPAIAVDEDENENDDDGKTNDDMPKWNDTEKRQLLEGIKMHGMQDACRLQAVIQTRSTFEVIRYLQANKETISKNGANPIELSAKNSPDSRLQDWEEIAKFLLSNCRDFSTPTLRKVLRDKFWEEELKNQERGGPFWNGQLSFGRIYLHLSDAVEGREKVALTTQEKRIMQYLIHDLADSVKTITNKDEIKTFFDSIRSAYRRNCLAAQRIGPSPSSSTISAEALCSLNLFCVPNNLLLERPIRSTDGKDGEMPYGGSSTMDVDERYETISVSSMNGSTDVQIL